MHCCLHLGARPVRQRAARQRGRARPRRFGRSVARERAGRRVHGGPPHLPLNMSRNSAAPPHSLSPSGAAAGAGRRGGLAQVASSSAAPLLLCSSPSCCCRAASSSKSWHLHQANQATNRDMPTSTNRMGHAIAGGPRAGHDAPRAAALAARRRLDGPRLLGRRPGAIRRYPQAFINPSDAAARVAEC